MACAVELGPFSRDRAAQAELGHLSQTPPDNLGDAQVGVRPTSEFSCLTAKSAYR